MDAFRGALDHYQLEDLGFRGYKFTWNNKRHGDAKTRLRGFKFERAWLLSDECEVVIKIALEMGGDEPSQLGLAKKKIEASAMELQAWGSSKAQPDSKEIKKLQKQIEDLNSAECTEESIAEFFTASENLNALIRKQEIYWVQRARIP